MKLNNKGITLTEIIISIALISIVLIFLFSLLILVKDINDESEVNSTYLINKSLILKNIENDLSKSTSLTLRRCGPDGIKNNIYSSYGVATDYFPEKKYEANECIILDYDNNESTENARLGIYYYKNRNNFVISYIYGTTKATRELPDFGKYNVNKSQGIINDNMKIEIKLGNGSSCGEDLSGCSNSTGFSTIKIPIIGEDEKDYSIIISYYGTISIG